MTPEIKDIRTATITGKGQISIPIIARKTIGFKEGTKVSVVVYSDRVELRPFREEKINDSLRCMLASEDALAKNWMLKEDEEAWKDL